MKRIFFLISILLTVTAFSQQEPLFSQYYTNGMIINPAISGSKIDPALIIQTRQQWVGFEGAPATSNISYHGVLNNRSAMGGYLMYDKSYPSMHANLQLNYAYHIPLDYDRINLSFGLGAKVMYYNLDFDLADLPLGNDNAFSGSSYDKTLADASAGVYLYGNDFYAGFSVSNMLQSVFNTPVEGSPYSNVEYRNYYGMGAYKFQIINKDWALEPSFLIRKMQFQNTISDFSTRILYLDNIWFGGGYRTNGTGIFGFGFGGESMHIAYSYDHIFAGDIMQYNYGTHELTLTFNILTDSRDRFRYSRY